MAPVNILRNVQYNARMECFHEVTLNHWRRLDRLVQREHLWIPTRLAAMDLSVTMFCCKSQACRRRGLGLGYTMFPNTSNNDLSDLQHRLTAAIAYLRQHHHSIQSKRIPENRAYQSPNLHLPIAIEEATGNQHTPHTSCLLLACNSAVGSRNAAAKHTRGTFADRYT
jgi:hypothetical protein